MKRILFIIILLPTILKAQMFGTDTAKIIDRANQWWATTYGQDRNFKLRKILFHPSQYAAASLPTGSTGALIWDTDSLRFRYYNGTDWVLITPDGGGGVAGVTSFNSRTGAVSLLTADVSGVGGFVNGGNTFAANSSVGNISNHALAILTNNTARINITATGDVSIPGNPLTVGGTVNAAINLQNNGSSTRGTLDVSGNNPRSNSATGIWLHASAGTTIATISANGIFTGGGSSATARLEMLAGTTAIAPMRFNSGPLLTTAIIGAVEFLTDKLYATITTATARKEITLNDAALTNGTIPQITTNGRLTDLTLTTGDILYASGTNAIAKRAIGSSGQILTVSGGVPVWSTPNTVTGNVYTATVTAVANVDATSAPAQWSYIQVGSQVYVWGSVDIDPTTTATVTQVRFSLPVAASFADENEAAGTAVLTNSGGNEAANIKAETTNEQAILTWTTTTTSNQRLFFSFGYRLGGS